MAVRMHWGRVTAALCAAALLLAAVRYALLPAACPTEAEGARAHEAPAEAVEPGPSAPLPEDLVFLDDAPLAGNIVRSSAEVRVSAALWGEREKEKRRERERGGREGRPFRLLLFFSSALCPLSV